ncbi:Hypothetical predicted protein [Olea europaea subsp. europaea]|uniref:Uncharacterized protein n=1 Tax=Olea europaea subsp. europaea TaxID=158383 RepID=A0A8S0VP62_OLEEU|nr:Hypothetical predicted protein [Olea europaea subsp. europaea]
MAEFVPTFPSNAFVAKAALWCNRFIRCLRVALEALLWIWYKTIINFEPSHELFDGIQTPTVSSEMAIEPCDTVDDDEPIAEGETNKVDTKAHLFKAR